MKNYCASARLPANKKKNMKRSSRNAILFKNEVSLALQVCNLGHRNFVKKHSSSVWSPPPIHSKPYPHTLIYAFNQFVRTNLGGSIKEAADWPVLWQQRQPSEQLLVGWLVFVFEYSYPFPFHRQRRHNNHKFNEIVSLMTLCNLIAPNVALALWSHLINFQFTFWSFYHLHFFWTRF